MKQLSNYDDDNIEQIGDDSFIVHLGHVDTMINDKHVIIDTIIKNDTIVIEKTCYEHELEIIEKLIQRPDFGKSFASVLIMVFVAYAILRKWRRKNQK